MELIHGGDVAGYELAHGRRPLDFSASLNPLGMPDGVVRAARAAVADATPYPDPLCRRLTRALAESFAIPPEYVFCGNGAADVIHRLVLARRPRTALIPSPSFAEYEHALRLVGCAVDFHPLREENRFALDDGVLGRVVPGLEMLFLCQPNNPTGDLIDPALLADIVGRCRECGTLLVVDECFLSLTGVREERTLVPGLAGNRHILVLESFTKLYAMAGLRLGFGLCGDAALIDSLRAAGQPWAVSSVAQAAGLAALEERAHVAESLRLIAAAKRELLAGLESLGCRCYGSAANYVFFHSAARDLDRRLHAHGILIRNCGNFRGLGDGYFRVAVRREEENSRLLRAMAAVGA